MNKFEKTIHNAVKTIPALKNGVKLVYQLLMSLAPVKKNSCGCKLVNRKGYFFGFHDKVPFSHDDKYLLSHRYKGKDNKSIQADDSVEVGYFRDSNYLDYVPLKKTYAWNWTQGSMLQWVGNSEKIIYNDFNGRFHISRIIDIEGNTITELPLPVGALSPSGAYAVSYNFARLRRGMPGYGYANGIDPDNDSNIPDSEASSLKLINLKNESVKELFKVADIAAYKPEKTMERAFHFFTHCLFAPDGKRFAFLHRWLVNGKRLFSRMITAALDGQEIHIFPTAGMVSHMAWKDNSHILAYANTTQYNDKYYLFRDQSDDFIIIGEDSFYSDGHPQFSPDGKYIVTDTYPDRHRRQHLYIYDLEQNEKIELAMLYLPFKYARGQRCDCDFHPRWNRAGNMICFDSAHTGIRSLCTIDISSYLSNR